MLVKAGCVPMDVLMPQPAAAVSFPPLIFPQPIGLELSAPCRFRSLKHGVHMKERGIM